MKEEWLMPGAFVPVDANTTGALVAEIKRLIGVVGGMALNQQRPWVGLTPENYNEIFLQARTGEHAVHLAEAKLKQKNGYAVGNIGLYMEALK